MLPVSDKIKSQLHVGNDAVALAQGFEIDSPEMADIAAKQRKEFDAQIKQMKKLQSDLVEPAMTIVERAKAIFTPTIKGLTTAKNVLGEKLLKWSAEEERRIAAERREREEAARKARQEAERKAAEAQARAEERAREARKAAEEAEAIRKRAEADGNARAAAAAAAKKAAAEERARSERENAAIKAAEEQAKAAAQVVESKPEAVKVAGFTTRENWVAEFEPGLDEADVIRKIAAELPNRPDFIGLLGLRMPAANKMAKALKSAFIVPGMKAVNKPIATGTRGK